MIHLVISFIFS